MKSFTPIIFFLLLISGCKKSQIGPTQALNCGYADSSNSHPKNILYKNILDKYVKQGMPGITAMLIDSNGTWIGASGYADIAEGVKFTPCNISKAASITKLMVGAMTLKLQEEGKINIDDPIAKYIDKDILDKI